MTNQEAIKYLEIYRPIITCTHRSSEIDKANKAFDIAINALKSKESEDN